MKKTPQSATPESEENNSVEKPVALTSLGFALRAYQKSNFRSGILFIISDFLDPGDFRTEMKLLAHRGFDLNLLQTLAPDEVSPEVGGDLLLVDSETGEAREITANERIVAAYKAKLAEYTTSLEMFCRSSTASATRSSPPTLRLKICC